LFLLPGFNNQKLIPLYLLGKSNTKKKIQKHTRKATPGWDIDALALVQPDTLNPLEPFTIQKKTSTTMSLSNAYAGGQFGNLV